MPNPSKLTVRITLDSGKELAISLDASTWAEIERMCPEHVMLFETWAEALDDHASKDT